MVVSPFGAPLDVRAWEAFEDRTGIPVVIDGAASFDTVQATRIPVRREPARHENSRRRRRRLHRHHGFEAARPSGRLLQFRIHGNAHRDHRGAEREDERISRRGGAGETSSAGRTRAAARANLRVVPRRPSQRLPGVSLQPGYGPGWVSSTTNIVLPPGSAPWFAGSTAPVGHRNQTWWGQGCHVQPAFADCPRGELAVTDDLGTRVWACPTLPKCGSPDMDAVVDALAGCLRSRDLERLRGTCRKAEKSRLETATTVRRRLRTRMDTALPSQRDYWQEHFRRQHTRKSEVGMARSMDYPNDRLLRSRPTGSSSKRSARWPANRLLDAGCGWGLLSRLAYLLGASPVGVDFVPETVQTLRSLRPDMRWEVADLTDPAQLTPLGRVRSRGGRRGPAAHGFSIRRSAHSGSGSRRAAAWWVACPTACARSRPASASGWTIGCRSRPSQIGDAARTLPGCSAAVLQGSDVSRRSDLLAIPHLRLGAGDQRHAQSHRLCDAAGVTAWLASASSIPPAPRTSREWLELWHAWPRREVFAHPEYLKLYAARHDARRLRRLEIGRHLACCIRFWSATWLLNRSGRSRRDDVRCCIGLRLLRPVRVGPRRSRRCRRPILARIPRLGRQDHGIVSEFVRFQSVPGRAASLSRAEEWKAAGHIVRSLEPEEPVSMDGVRTQGAEERSQGHPRAASRLKSTKRRPASTISSRIYEPHAGPARARRLLLLRARLISKPCASASPGSSPIFMPCSTAWWFPPSWC